MKEGKEKRKERKKKERKLLSTTYHTGTSSPAKLKERKAGRLASLQYRDLSNGQLSATNRGEIPESFLKPISGFDKLERD
jgi:hypothetical protein